MNYQKQENKKRAISLIWIISVLAIVISNAAITIIGRMQHGMFGDKYNNEFLIISLAGAAISLFVLGFIYERDNFKSTIRHGFVFGAFAGIFNGISNLLILVTYKYLPISFTSPVKSGIGIILSFVMSVIMYKEKFSRRQLVSAFIGIIAVVLMNL